MKKAQDWCDEDPAIQAGTLRVELHKWYAAKGITYDKSAEKKLGYFGLANACGA